MTHSTPFPSRVGVLGGGRMGAGIAHAFLITGSAVTIVERDAAAADAAYGRIEKSVARSLERGVLTSSAEETLARLAVSTRQDDFADRELVVEAVPEDWELKVASLQGIEAHLGDHAVLASNTSSLSVTGLAKQLQRPERFLGLHFFNPVPASQLIEVVIGEQTNATLVDAARSWTTTLGKTAVVVHDAPGFASSRLGLAIALEAMRMVEEGVAEPEDIDNAMVLGYKHHTGPLRTSDLVGLDVRLGIAEYLESNLGPRFAPPQILRDKVAAGELGMKTGRGFFDWEAPVDR